jgi:polar amino acid transport system substrate-binding protein
MSNRIKAGLAVLAGAALLLTGCSGSGDTTGSASNTSGLTTVTSGTLTICTNPPFMPFEYEDASGVSGSGYAGFDVDLSYQIAQNLGLKFAVAPTDFDTLQSGMALESGKCDFGASGITITDERKANLDFSDPYYDSLQSLLVRSDSGITNLDGLAGKSIAVQTGTTGESYAKEHATSATIRSFPSDGEMWLALQAGQVDAILQDQPVNYQHEKSDSSYKIVATYNTDESNGLAFAKGKNDALLKAVNEQLENMKSNGAYDKLYTEYFGASNASASPAASNS